MMFQLHKNRSFSTYINDTFLFFKMHGKSYFKNYFIINGALLLLLIAIVFFGFQFYFQTLFSNLGNPGLDSNPMVNMLTDNVGFIAFFAILIMVLFFFISVLQYAFPVIYFDLFDKKNTDDIEPSEILQSLKQKSFKIFKFFIALIFIITPIIVLIFGLNILLFFIIIGIPLFFITAPAALSWVNISFYHYLNSTDRLFPSLALGFKYLKQQFWTNVGSTMIMIIIIQIVMTIFTTIPYLLGMVNMFTDFSPQSGPINPEQFSALPMLMTVVMVISLVANYILSNLIIVNQGLIYYSQKETEENTSANHSIDLIGSDSE
ncbi:hypothetical protein ABS764_05560 [Flavobacterium sp. ST-87]|uniref:Membrane domain of glycerophosphoryl diester phosphodiesterase n=1 Tax=Flavobacterium plantiphilum TaxID=3163297 RepID=A0ABW8XSQ8_9FLAO